MMRNGWCRPHLAEYGRVDILINNAATFGSGKHIAEIDEEEWDRGDAIYLCSKFVIPPMRARVAAASSLCHVSGVVAERRRTTTPPSTA